MMGGNSLADLGLSSAESLTLKHELLISPSESLARPLCRALTSFSDASHESSKAFKIVAYGVATYLVLMGVARVIEVSKSSSRRDETA
mmetsp:Transcript_24799/g.36387  ORF Transcript_24799/g.36387 Transcript_24799/m.36387 type:complete len:88 (+) Transcript_24799:256-519(+)